MLSYLWFSSLNIFLQNDMLCYYGDSFLSEIKSIFYFLSVIAYIMNHNICVPKKAFFFFHYHTDTFISFICEILYSSNYIYRCCRIEERKQISVVLSWFHSVQMMTIHRFTPHFLTFQLITWLQSLLRVDYALKYLRNGQ